ncbi:MAG: primosomal protein N' (replication factor Y) [Cryomorphaceae bacterium]|jgi:primosomal protein N' (replication factor Y)
MDSAKPSKQNVQLVQVAVPIPLRQSFDFLVPESDQFLDNDLWIGARVKVPFGSRKLIGVITGLPRQSEYPQHKLKHAIEILDFQSLFESPLWSTLEWISRYYLAPIGEVIEAAMPVALRQGAPLMPPSKKTWRLSDHGRSSSIDELNRAPLQLAIIKRFMRNSFLDSSDFKRSSAGWRQAVAALHEKRWIEEFETTPKLSQRSLPQSSELQMNAEQISAINTLSHSIEANKFSCSLLHGVTGSGKTEVYFAAIQQVLDLGKQVLLLVPEIGLTPQLIDRIESRFKHPVVAMHSGLNDSERHLGWWHAKEGNARIVIGTRSAVFSSFKDLGLIIIDEEHDGSLKQQDSVRYQARDVAIYRAKQHDIAIILGSATPSLESYLNAQQGRYQLLRLKQRATQVQLPRIQMLDLNTQPSTDGLSPAMLEMIGQTLARDKQAMLFLNRRGYAPVMYCKDCGETTKCHRCDSHLTLHRRVNRMRCHHCGYEGRALSACGSCKSENLVEVGEGTQRVEDALELRFPDARVLRIDRDSTRRKGELQSLLQQARDGQADILLGTQLISKGHDFPNVAMVGVLEADQGLYSTDFRASEALFQQLVQVSGRAGRRDQVGQVFIQTRFPQHPFFAKVMQHDFEGFAAELLGQRKLALYPPFGHFALLRAESTHQAKALQFLRRARQELRPHKGVQLMDAIPAPMERRAGKYRAQLLITADQRSSLNATLVMWLNHLSSNAEAKKRSAGIRWSLDIDPLDHY